MFLDGHGQAARCWREATRPVVLVAVLVAAFPGLALWPVRLPTWAGSRSRVTC
jgi:hypothetical protein